MEQPKKSSKHLVLMGGIVAVVVIIAVAITLFAMLNTTKKEAATTASPSPTPTVATKAQVQQSLAELETTMKQAASDQAAAKSAINDGTNQVKVGS